MTQREDGPNLEGGRVGVDDVESDPEEAMYSTVPLEDEDGNEYVIQQQSVGRERLVGGGEFPDPETPPRAPAPGSAVDHEPDDDDAGRHG